MRKLLKLFENYEKHCIFRRVYDETYNELSCLSDRQLKDIGISRLDISIISEQTASETVNQIFG